MRELISIDSDEAEKARLQWEKARARRERYEAKTARRNHHGSNNVANPNRPKYRDYQFVMWDGECPTDTGYSLFGSSLGHEICEPHLTTEQCFDLLLEAKRENPYTIFFWFGGRYDWDEITRQSIPLQKLARLKNEGTLWWHGYRLEEIEGKVYKIKKDGVQVVIFEVTGWFHCAYASALRQYRIGNENCHHVASLCPLETCRCRCTLCRIELGKGNRSIFQWAEIEDIRRYMRDELALGPALMDAIRRICLDAGFNPHSWYGPSALARELLTKNKIRNSMALCPPAVNKAFCYGFAGGRFEPFRGGIIDVPVTEADENSAYMFAALDLPNLARGHWRKGCGFEPGKFAIYHVRYEAPFEPMRPQPLFCRYDNGNVAWPNRVEGWYCSPEAELVHDSPYATFLESYVFDEDDECDRPFSFVREMYRRRLLLQETGSQAEKAFKWGLAAIYGQLCRLVGWDKKNGLPPSTHQLEWAAYITSKCRADMYRVALAAGDKLISIDTDSVTAMCDIDVPTGKNLGQWKLEKSDGGVFYQSGVYFTRVDGKWKKAKTRGMESRRGTFPVTPELLSAAIKTNSNVKLHPKRRYITTRMALNGQTKHHGTWREHPANVLQFGGGGKRNHQGCRSCHGNVHNFGPSIDSALPITRMSRPHKLPWQAGYTAPEIDVKLLADILWVDPETIDSDDVWLAELVAKETPKQRREKERQLTAAC